MTERKLRKMVRGYKGVRAYIPYGPTQLQKMVKERRLAPPIKIGPRAIAWFEDDLIAAQEEFERERDGVSK
jgi:hypothetical protein